MHVISCLCLRLSSSCNPPSRVASLRSIALFAMLFAFAAAAHPQQPVPHPQLVPRAYTGTVPGTASFLGNATTITTPSQVLGLERQANCSLTLLSGTYTLSTSLTYTRTAIAANYDRTLHNEALLTTTPGLYSNGCASPSTGIGSRVGYFVGTTTSGINVFAGIDYSFTTMGNALYLMTGSTPTNYAITNFSFASATALTAADLNKDGNADLVIANGTLTTAGTVSVLTGNANGTFNTAVAYPTAGTGAVAVVIDDFNNDGKLDLAVVSNDQHISILLGKGDGTFSAAQTFAAPALPGYTSASATPIVNIISADVNGDGKKDLIGSNGLVLLGNGDGTFNAVTTAAFPYPSSLTSQGPNLASGDINKDGKLDLVVGTGSQVLTYLGNGDGTFTAGKSYAAINSVGYVTVNDLDGDGNPDIYVGLANGGSFEGDGFSNNLTYALMGNGDGTFQGAPTILGSFNGANLGDVNGDGQQDLISNGLTSTNVPTPTLTVQLGTPNGTFKPVSTITAPASFSIGYQFTGVNTVGATTYAVADLNGDGYADLVFIDNNLTAINPGNNQPVVYPNPILFIALSNGDGTFKTPVPYTFPQIAPVGDYDISVTINSLRLADVTGDGKIDLICNFSEISGNAFGGPAYNAYNQGIMVLPGLGTGLFDIVPSLTYTYSSNTAPTTALLPQLTNVADLNGDGKADLVVINPTFSVSTGAVTQLETFLGNGDGTFKAPTTITSANVYGFPVLVDLNKDNKLDLAFITETTASQGQLNIALGNGDGTFQTPAILNLSGGDAIRSASLAAADFNADGKIDLALIAPEAFSGIYYGNGDGTFQSVTSNSSALPQDLINLFVNPANNATALDLNKDGKPDILVGNTTLLNEYGVTVTSTIGSSTALTASATTAIVGASITFTATVTPASGIVVPTGSVTFYDGTTKLSTVTVSTTAVATYTTSALAAGPHTISAVYSGDANYVGSTSSNLAVTINAVVATSTSLSASATSVVSGTSVTLNAAVTAASGTAVPTGTLTFYDGTTSLGAPTLSGTGTATFTSSSFAVGTHTLTASYGGATTFSASTSSAVTLTVTAPPTPDFSLALSPASTTVVHGSTATTTLTLTPTGGFSAATSITCTGAPANSICAASPNSLTPSGSAVSTTITLATQVTTGELRLRPGNIAYAALPAAFFAGLLLFGSVRRRRSPLPWTLLACALLASLAATTGCGGKSNPAGTSSTTATTAPGTYTLTLTGASGTTSHTATWTVTVQ
jgi:hypothetical protein